MQYRYVGQDPRLQGRTALATFAASNNSLLVQFDEPIRDRGGKSLHLGWHEFPASDWEKIEEAA